MNNLNVDKNFDHHMSLSKSKYWYSNNCLHFLKLAVSLKRDFFDIRTSHYLKNDLKIVVRNFVIFLEYALSARLNLTNFFYFAQK
jgi:hypothetical protein